MKTNGNASLPPWGELEGGCTNGNATLPPWGELEGGCTSGNASLPPWGELEGGCTNGNATLPPWGELEGGCTSGNASLPPWGELEGGCASSVIIYNEDIDALEHELSLRIVHMIYRKKDGSLRDAYGTRCHAIIPPEYHPKGLKTPPAFLLNYWDTQRGGWRCLIRDRLIGFEEN